jgi:hypothetical protein
LFQSKLLKILIKFNYSHLILRHWNVKNIGSFSKSLLLRKMSDHNSNSNQSTEKKEGDIPKLKILAFHGYRQNGALFRGKIGSFRKAVSKYAQLTFISAPHKVFNEDGGGDEG